MTVADLLVDTLGAHGIETVFGIPGTQTLPLNTAIEGRDELRFVMARHETAVTHEAWGYAETSGRMAATLVVPGPGDVNAMNGLKNALNDCTPLVHLSVETDPALRGGDSIHELEPETYDTVVKENVTVETPQSAVAETERAIEIALAPPKGPVRIGIPRPFLTVDTGIAPGEGTSFEPMTDLPAAEIESVAARVDDADEPLIIAGGGVRRAGAADSLRTVAEHLGSPVATTYKGKGTFPEDHALSLGVLGRSASPAKWACVEDSDVVLAVGTDLDALVFREWVYDLPDLIHITLEAGDIGRGYTPTMSLVADADELLAELVGALEDRSTDVGTDRVEAVRAADAERLHPIRNDESLPMTTPRALFELREFLPRETVVTVDVSGLGTWSMIAFEAYDPRSFVTPGSWGTMGTGLPAAIGAQVANPERDVVALTGDGGLLMCMQELHTAVAEDIPVVVVVFNNNDYAIISRVAERTTDSSAGYSWPEAPVSFNEIGAGLGMTASTAESPAELREAVTTALGADEPVLVEIPISATDPEVGAVMG